MTGTKILFTEDRDPGDTTLEFEIATLASDGSGFSGGKPISFLLSQAVSSRRM